MPSHSNSSSVLDAFISMETMRLMLRLASQGNLPVGSADFLQKTLDKIPGVPTLTKIQPYPLAELPSCAAFACSGEVGSANGKTVFDFSICNPPFGILNPDLAMQMGIEDKRLENFFLRKCMEQLKVGGRCCCIVPNGLLSRISRSDINLRRTLVEKHRLESVILLPLDTFPRANVYTAILTFTKTADGGTDRVWVYDLRTRSPQQVEQGLVQYLLTLSGKEAATDPDISVLKLDALRTHHYFLLPENYKKSMPTGFSSKETLDRELGELQKMREKILHEQNEDSVQLNFFTEAGKGPSSEILPDAGRMELQRLDLKYNETLMQQAFYETFYQDDSFFARWSAVSGAELFTVRSGQKLPKGSAAGEFPVFGANGVKRYCDCYNVSGDSPFLVIGRVGSYCGTVQKAAGRCWITDNALYLTGYQKPVNTDFLFCLMRFMNLNQYKNGSCIPQITQSLLLDLQYILPPLEVQNAFADKISAAMAEYDRISRELEQLEFWTRQKL